MADDPLRAPLVQAAGVVLAFSLPLFRVWNDSSAKWHPIHLLGVLPLCIGFICLNLALFHALKPEGRYDAGRKSFIWGTGLITLALLLTIAHSFIGNFEWVWSLR